MRVALLLTIMAVIFGAALIAGATNNALRFAANTSRARTPADLYAKNCASCHGKDGHAKTFKAKFNHARDLTDSAWQENVSDERLFNSINNGKGKNMPAYGKKLSEKEIDSLVTFVRGLKK